MGRYDSYQVREKEEQVGPHPMWRGIGCILLVLIVVMSFAGAVELVKANRANNWVPVPQELKGSLPKITRKGEPILYVELAVAFLLAVFGFGVFVLFYSIVYRVGSPKKKDVTVHDVKQ